MASCSVIRDKDSKEIKSVFAPNNEPSKLYSDILKSVGDKEEALRDWASYYTQSYKEKYGDWEKDPKSFKGKLDANGEPQYQSETSSINPEDLLSRIEGGEEDAESTMDYGFNETNRYRESKGQKPYSRQQYREAFEKMQRDAIEENQKSI